MEDILKYFLLHQAIAKHTGIASPPKIRTFTFIPIMKDNESYQNIFLDNQVKHQLKLLYRALQK